uniref:Uncharacterized protein n=1 Tax=Setaria digitata TaxID=48799 RepID=A0A915Q204_9BILA
MLLLAYRQVNILPMHYSSTRFIIFFILISILSWKCTSWVQPRISIKPGFLNIYSTGENFVNSGDLIIGQPYTLDIRMTDTDRYDYLLQFCTYNDKYRFVDQNSCLVCDKFFQQMWENDMYRLQGTTKRTIIHFMPPESLARLECSVRILQCCGCAERACERNILPTLVTYPQQVINLAIINERAVGFFGTSLIRWPWWIWLLIFLGLILLLCLLPLFLLLCSQLWVHKRKIRDSKEAVLRPTPPKAPSILVRAKELETSGVSVESSRPTVPPPPPTKIFCTQSGSPSESVHSFASYSRVAVVKQRQPPMFWEEGTIRSAAEPKPTLEQRRITERHSERVIEEWGEVDEYHDYPGSGSKFHFGTDEYHIGQMNSEKAVHHSVSGPSQMLHQQTTCEEKFFKRSERQKGMLEEGYDRIQFTYVAPALHVSHSEVV